MACRVGVPVDCSTYWPQANVANALNLPELFDIKFVAFSWGQSGIVGTHLCCIHFNFTLINETASLQSTHASWMLSNTYFSASSFIISHRYSIIIVWPLQIDYFVLVVKCYSEHQCSLLMIQKYHLRFIAEIITFGTMLLKMSKVLFLWVCICFCKFYLFGW